MQLAMTRAKASLQRYNQLFLLVAVLIIATVISHGVFIRPTNLILVMASAAAFGLVSFGQALGRHRRGIRSGRRLSRRHVDLGDRVFSRGLWHCRRHDWGSRLRDGRRARQRPLCVANEDSAVHRHARHVVGRRLDVVDPRRGSADHGARVQRLHLAAVRVLSAWRELFSDHRPDCRIRRDVPASPSEQVGALHLRDRRQRSGRANCRRAGDENEAALLWLVRVLMRGRRDRLSIPEYQRDPGRGLRLSSV